MTPNCDTQGCERKSVHRVYIFKLLDEQVVKVRMSLCPGCFNNYESVQGLSVQAKQ